MEIKLNKSNLEILKDSDKLSFREPLDPTKMVIEIVNGKQVVTFSASEFELRAVYELLKGRFHAG